MAITNLNYSTTQYFAEILGLENKVPSRDVGATPSTETVGIGDDSNKIFYLDQLNIINNSQTLFYGAAATTTAELIEPDDYTIDLDSGKITLTDAGVTKLSTSTIFASYSYFNNGMSDSYLTRVLERAEKEVDDAVNSTFTDGTATNPTYPSTTEIQPSPGYFRNQLIMEKKPLIDITSALDGDVDISQNTIDLTAGTGTKFPTTGYIVVGSEVMSYTGITIDQLTGVTRGVLDSDAATHTDLDEVHSTIFFLSNTQEGTSVEWTVQPWDTQMHASDEALFYSYDQSVFEPSQYPNRLTKQDVANRVRAIYYYGYDTISEDITRLTLLLAKRQLIQDNIGKSMIAGRDEFRPEMFNVDTMEIQAIVNDYIVLPMGNT